MKKIKLKENQLIEIINKVISEQKRIAANDPRIMSQKELDTKYGQTTGPGKNMGETQIRQTEKMGASLFANGVDKIDTGSDAFQRGVQAIQNAINKNNNDSIEIVVEGGASAVGNQTGYDNKSLATRRATNFINSVRRQFPNVKFKVTTNVGVATVKNSPEANQEQYVKLIYNVPGMKISKIGPAVDNTQLAMRNTINTKDDLGGGGGEREKYVKVCYEIPAIYADSLTKSIIKNLRGRVAK